MIAVARTVMFQSAVAALLAATAAAQAAPQQQSIQPLAIEDAVGAAEFQAQGGLGAISPDGALHAYAACDPRRVQKDTTGQASATVNSAYRSLGCDLRLTTLADGTTRTIATTERGGHWGPA